jgi:hypothetical protein
MVNPEIVKYLQEGKARGFSVQLLKQKLLEGGFDGREVDEAINSIGKVPPKTAGQVVSPQHALHSVSGEKQGLFWKIKKSISSPKELFEKTSGEGIWQTLKYQLVLMIVPFVLGSLMLIFLISFLASIAGAFVNSIPGASSQVLTFSLVGSLIMVGSWGLMLYIGGTVAFFLGSGVLHLVLKIYNGKGDFGDTFRAGVYSSTPAILFGTIPFLNFLIPIWSFILSIIGVSVTHSISKLRAFFSLLSIWIFFLVVYLAFYAITLYSS